MGMEIERKFLVDIDKIKEYLPNKYNNIVQGYIPSNNGTTIRIRISDEIGYLTIKGKTNGFSRSEYEYEIPLEDAKNMLDTLCDERIIKKRSYIIENDNNKWEVDFFELTNKGLVVAEIELESENEEVSIPNWIKNEVTDEKKYYNVLLMENPFSTWK